MKDADYTVRLLLSTEIRIIPKAIKAGEAIVDMNMVTRIGQLQDRLGNPVNMKAMTATIA